MGEASWPVHSLGWSIELGYPIDGGHLTLQLRLCISDNDT